MNRRALTEQVSAPDLRSATIQVDREAGVIRNVRVLGRLSKNRYEPGTDETEYTAACLTQARPLYEGVKVLIDHPQQAKPTGSRSARDVFGTIRNVRSADDALVGDLHYLKSHPLAESVTEDVDRQLGVYGLSHNATGGAERIDRKARRLVIESIAAVKSVDLVSEPATNRNLWESVMPSPTTFRALLESLTTTFDATKQAKVRTLLEMDGMGDMPVMSDAPSTDPDQALMDGFRAAIVAVIGQYEAGDVDAKAAIDKIGKLLTTHEDLTGDGSDTETEDPADEPGTEMTEAVREQLAELAVRRLCEQVQYSPKPPMLRALMALPDDTSRRQLIESVNVAPAAPPGARKPRSGTPGGAAGATPSTADAINVLRGN